MNDPETIDVELAYPRSGGPRRVVIHLVDVRAASSLIVEYDFERDGWSIQMDRTREHSTMMQVVVQDEMAFVPAWNEE